MRNTIPQNRSIVRRSAFTDDARVFASAEVMTDLKSAIRTRILDVGYYGEVFFSRLQGIAYDNPRRNGEYALIRCLRDRIRCAIDVGCNIGDWTNQVLHETSGNCVIACVEPDAQNAALIARRFANREVRVYEAAVSDEDASAIFVAGNGRNSGVGHLARSAEDIGTNIRTMTLESLVRDFCGSSDADLVKVDIEGAEMSLLAGAASLFAAKRIGVMQLEYNSTWIGFGRRMHDLFDFAVKHEYAVLMATPLGFTRLPRYGIGLEDFRLRNLILARADYLDALKPLGPAGRARVERDRL